MGVSEWGAGRVSADNFLYILEPLKFLVRIQCLLILWFIVRRLLLLKRENKFFSLESQARTVIPSTSSSGAGMQPSLLLVYSNVQQWPAQVPASVLCQEWACFPQWLFVSKSCDAEVVWEGNSKFSFPKGQGIFFQSCRSQLPVLSLSWGAILSFWSLLEKAVIGRCCMPNSSEGRMWQGLVCSG